MKQRIPDLVLPNIMSNGKTSPTRETLIAVLKAWQRRLGYFSIFAALPAVIGSQLQEAKGDELKPPAVPVSGAANKARRLRNPNNSSSTPAFLRRQGSYLLPHQKGEFNIAAAQLTGSDNCPGTAIPAGVYTAAAPFTNTGNTAGANNTVTSLRGYYYYYTYNFGGPDLVYAFTVTALGPAPKIRITPTSADYAPAVYILYGGNGGGCPAGIENTVGNYYAARWSSPGNPVEMSFGLPLDVPLHLFVDSYGSAPATSGPYTLQLEDMTVGVTRPPRANYDFDGDAKADISVFRPSDTVWYSDGALRGFNATQFGVSADRIVPADYDGDGKTDIAVFRDGVWYWLGSSDGSFNAEVWGVPGDVPVPADYTGDGRADLAIYRDGVWWTFDLANRQVGVLQFGVATDKPVAADYDGDGRADHAVFRDGVWYLNNSTEGLRVLTLGQKADRPVPADYDGDHRADPAVYRDGVWYCARSRTGLAMQQWGVATDVLVPADYDGDGGADIAIYRDGTWWLLQGSSGISVRRFGTKGDSPIANAFAP